MSKKITREELEVFLRKHKLWLEDDPEGERANLYVANLYGADLRGANLYVANLYGANLCGADLYGADLRGANLYVANLYEANLRGANLYGADLRGADLRGANLRGADLREANLRGADLRGADLREANLRGANLYGADLREANLRGANLREARGITPIACPEKGSFTAFKKAGKYIIELLIPKDAKRCSATSRKCRCSKAKVVSITNFDGSDAGVTSVNSNYDSSFVYSVGKTVRVDNFEEDRWNECAPGIHFFITRQEAVEY